ncbi:hypothetical protein CEXT_187131 [Caerostris extrusa]|uniref:Mitochondria-eating protein n=1 Tax=Caerostris extrusa TaxID=172846 RepID=A0AAV4PCG1_CAEEX|nr:hypothetical protein CEXT_187131 [Caerostris extrusa]
MVPMMQYHKQKFRIKKRNECTLIAGGTEMQDEKECCLYTMQVINAHCNLPTGSSISNLRHTVRLPIIEDLRRIEALRERLLENCLESFQSVPPFVIEYEERVFRKDLHVRFHTSNQESDRIKTYLWPTLMEGRNGPCVHKGSCYHIVKSLLHFWVICVVFILSIIYKHYIF